MATSIRMEIKQCRPSEVSCADGPSSMLVKNSDGSSNRVFPALLVKGRLVIELENINFNPKWSLAITSNGSRYWVHPESGKVITIKEV